MFTHFSETFIHAYHGCQIWCKTPTLYHKILSIKYQNITNDYPENRIQYDKLSNKTRWSTPSKTSYNTAFSPYSDLSGEYSVLNNHNYVKNKIFESYFEYLYRVCINNVLRWVLLITTEIKYLNHGLRFAIFRTLFGSNRKYTQSLCPHNSFVYLQFDLEDCLEI